MAGWTKFPLTEATRANWREGAVEIFRAALERSRASSYPTFDYGFAPLTGAKMGLWSPQDATDKYAISAVQLFGQLAYAYWCDLITYPDLQLEGQAAIPVYDVPLMQLWMANWFAGWTGLKRVKGDGTVTTGRGYAGDRNGTWLWQELFRLLNLYSTTVQGPSVQYGNPADNYIHVTGSGESWADAKADAEADWIAGNIVTGADAMDPLAVPGAWSKGYTGLGTYYAEMFRCCTKGLLENLSFNEARTPIVDFYSLATNPDTNNPEAVFDANGDDVLDSVMHGLGARITGQDVADGIETETLGAAPLGTQPAWCDEPVGDAVELRGWTGNFLSVQRWNTDGAFVYWDSKLGQSDTFQTNMVQV